MKIHYYFRNKLVGYSIQMVFQTIVNQVGELAPIKITYLPSPLANAIAIIKNGIYARKRQNKGEINHITGDVHYLLYFLKSKKTIVTVHDIMYYHYLHGIKKWLWKVLYIYPLRKAAFVTFISDFAKQQVLETIHLPENKMKIIPNPVNPNFRFTFKRFNASKPRILHIGTMKRKNLHRTILALKDIACHLRIIGHIDSETIRLLHENNIDYSNSFDLNESQLIQEYQEADIINFPSLFEGFGMPIIEGQTVGRVVVTSNLSPMKEVAGNGAFLVNPLSVDEIRKAYSTIIASEDLRDLLIRRGVENSSYYAASKIAREYMQIYQFLQQ